MSDIINLSSEDVLEPDLLQCHICWHSKHHKSINYCTLCQRQVCNYCANTECTSLQSSVNDNKHFLVEVHYTVTGKFIA